MSCYSSSSSCSSSSCCCCSCGPLGAASASLWPLLLLLGRHAEAPQPGDLVDPGALFDGHVGFAPVRGAARGLDGAVLQVQPQQSA